LGYNKDSNTDKTSKEATYPLPIVLLQANLQVTKRRLAETHSDGPAHPQTILA